MKDDAAHAAFIKQVADKLAPAPLQNHSARGWFSAGICGLQVRFELAQRLHRGSGEDIAGELNAAEFALPGYIVAEIAALAADDADASDNRDTLNFMALLIAD